MNKIQKIILLFLVYNYTLCSRSSIPGEPLISIADDYGEWLKDTEVTDDMKNNWRNQRDRSNAYLAKAGRSLGQKPEGNILVIPFADRILTLRSSIYPLGHLYRAYDSKDLADILLGTKEARLLKTTNFFYNEFSQIAIKIPDFLELIKEKKDKEEQLTNVTDEKIKGILNSNIKSLQKNISGTIIKINKLMKTIKDDLEKEIFANSIEEPAVAKLKTMSPYLNIDDTKFNDTIETINNENDDLYDKNIQNLKKYCEKVINYFVFLEENFSYNTKEDIEALREKIQNANNYISVHKILQDLEESENTDCALAHTEMMFRYYVCKNRLIPPENIYSYLDLCNKCEQMLAKDIGMYTGERGFYAVSEIKFKSNTNYTTPSSLLKKYRLPPPPHIDSADTDSKTEEKT